MYTYHALSNKPTYVSVLGLDEAKALANSLSEKARAALQEFPASADPLRELAAFVVSRLHWSEYNWQFGDSSLTYAGFHPL